MKQNLLFLIVLYQFTIYKSCTRPFRASCLLMVALILFSHNSLAQLVQQWNVFASTEGCEAQRFSHSALDEENNLYLLGSQDSPGGEHTLTLMKYDANGKKVWHRKLENVYYSKREFPITLKVGKQGDIFVLALTSLNNGGQGLLFYKVSADGVTQWMTPYTYRYAGIDRAYDFELSANDDIIVAGFCSTTQGHDMFALRIDKAGKLTWERRLDNIRGHSTYGPTLALDPAGDPYIAVRGRILSQDVRPYPLLLKLDGASGQVITTKKYTEPEMGGDGDGADPRQLHINAEGMIYTVSQTTIGYQYAILLTKADADGNMIWSKVEDFDGAGSVVMWDMAVDAEENLIFSTWPYGTQLTKYSKDGTKQWARQFKEGAGRSVAVDGAGNIAVTGGIMLPDRTRSVMVLTQFDKQGELLSEEIFDSAEPLFSAGEQVIFDKLNNLYLSGPGRSMGKDQVITLKFGTATANCDTPIAIKLILPPGGQQVGKPVSTTAMLEADNLPANVSARWTWGDGSSSAAYHTSGESHVTGQHTYSSVGIYTVGLDFDNTCLKPTTTDYAQRLAVFDPAAGFVTGSGWFTPANLPDAIPDQALKVQFEFDIKYKQQGEGGLIPTGSTSFKFANLLRFESTSYDWLVVKDDKAVWQGSGQINGRGDFGFTVSVIDDGEGKDKRNDMVRVSIWDKSQGNRLYYDSYGSKQIASFLSEQGPAIGGGNIVIHRKGSLQPDKNGRLVAGVPEGLSEELEAYPNPFTNTAQLRFELKEQGSYTLALYDLKGALVQELKQGNGTAGEQVEVIVEAGALPPGMYLARLVTAQEARSVKLILQK